MSPRYSPIQAHRLALAGALSGPGAWPGLGATRPGRPGCRLCPGKHTRLKVITMTGQEAPPNATHWSRSAMAEAVGISQSSVGRIWAAAGLKPHLTRGFKVSNDPMFGEKVT